MVDICHWGLNVWQDSVIGVEIEMWEDTLEDEVIAIDVS